MALELLWLVGSGLLFLDLRLESALELLLVEAVVEVPPLVTGLAGLLERSTASWLS